MIGFVTDSNAQLPAELVERYAVEVVPLTVTVDGTPYLEGVDIDADSFYARFESGQPEVSTSQPSPGLFTEAYERVAARGIDEILSVHIGSAVSGTINAARLAAQRARSKVRLVDTGTASFGVSCCLWEAAEAVLAGASLEEAAQVAEQVGSTVDNIFIVKALDLARAGGRLSAGARAGDAIPVLRLVQGEMETVGEARDIDEAVEVMGSFVQSWGTALRVGVGVADAGTGPLGDALASTLAAAGEVLEVVRYRIGPSVGVHTGPGTVGACYYPARKVERASRI
jgi:DegV family protein with EDD domain